MELLKPGTELAAGDLTVTGVAPGSRIVLDQATAELPHGFAYRGRLGHHRVLVTLIDPSLLARPEHEDALSRDIAWLARLRHPNLLPTLGMAPTDVGVAIVRHDPECLTVRQLIHQAMAVGKRIEIPAACTIGAQVCDALSALHPDLLHLYLTPDTVHATAQALVSGAGEGTLVLRSAGVDRFRRAGLIPSPPELLQRPERPRLESDVYAVGVLVIEMLAARTVERAGQSLPELGVEGPPALLRTLASTIGPDPGDRPTLAELRAGLLGALRPEAGRGPPPAPQPAARPGPPPPPVRSSRPVPTPSAVADDWSALDRATRHLLEMEAPEADRLTAPVGEDPAASLGLSIAAFEDAAARLETLDGESGLLGVATAVDAYGRTDEERSAELRLEQLQREAMPDGNYFGTFAEGYDATARPRERDSGLIELGGPDRSRVLREDEHVPSYLVTRKGVDHGPYSLTDLGAMIRKGELVNADVLTRRRDASQLLAVDHPKLRTLFEARARAADRRLKTNPHEMPVPASLRAASADRGSGGSSGTLMWIVLAVLVFAAAGWVLWQRSGGG